MLFKFSIYKTTMPLALIGYEKIEANLAQRSSFNIYRHFLKTGSLVNAIREFSLV